MSSGISRGAGEFRALFVITVLTFAVGVALPMAESETPSEPEATPAKALAPIQAEGKQVYEKYCVGCHGAKGDGEGVAARWLDPRPRDFTVGDFKFRTTPSGSLPTDSDLMRTIAKGVCGTAMPAWSLVPEGDRRAVIAYLKTFSSAWEDDEPRPALAMPGKPDYLGEEDVIAEGREIFLKMQCSSCHGDQEKGEKPQRVITDKKGREMKPFDFSRPCLKGGGAPEDIYRTISTGLTGMPSFYNSMKDGERWALVAYIYSLRGKKFPK